MKRLTSVHERLMDVAKGRVTLLYPERQLLLYCRDVRLKVREVPSASEIDLGPCTLDTAWMFCRLFGIDPRAFVFEVRESEV